MLYRLKPSEEAFQVTREGPFEYHRFVHFEIYDMEPEEEKKRFEMVQTETIPPKTKKGGEK